MKQEKIPGGRCGVREGSQRGFLSRVLKDESVLPGNRRNERLQAEALEA